MARPRPATFSIAARDPETDAVGVAVHSKFISVGSVIPFVNADAGAVATQSFANVAYGPDGLDLPRRGYDAESVVETHTARDAEAPQRQVGVVEAPTRGDSVAAFTGEECFDVAGDLQGDHYTVQGNILENRETLEAMADAFETGDGDLPERMLSALHAGNEAGGTRGANSRPRCTSRNPRAATTAGTTGGSTSASTTARRQSRNSSACSISTTSRCWNARNPKRPGS